MKNLSLKKARLFGLSLSFRLAFLYAVIFIISAAILAAFAYYFITNFVQRQELQIIQSRLDEYRAWFIKGGPDAVAAHFDADRARDGDVWFVRVVDSAGNELLARNAPQVRSLDLEQLTVKRGQRTGFWLTVETADGEGIWTMASVPLYKKVVLELGRNSTQTHQLLSYIEMMFLLKVLPIVLLGAIGGLLFTYHALRPIRQLVYTVRDILDSNKMSMRVPEEDKSGDLHDLVRTFNELLDRNETLIEAMRTSLDSIAHDLRTPLTRLRFHAEQALQKSEDPRACAEAIGECLEESDQVLTILRVFAEVAKAESGAMRLKIEEVPLIELVQQIIDLYQILAEEKNVSFVVSIPDNFKVAADRVRLKQALANLVDNAVKYCAAGTPIVVKAANDDGQAVISVKDQGIGIAEQDIDRIWERLYRAGSQSGQPGLGLGLSFVRAIVRAHGGEVEVSSKLQQGSVFTIVLPGPDVNPNPDQ